MQEFDVIGNRVRGKNGKKNVIRIISGRPWTTPLISNLGMAVAFYRYKYCYEAGTNKKKKPKHTIKTKLVLL